MVTRSNEYRMTTRRSVETAIELSKQSKNASWQELASEKRDAESKPDKCAKPVAESA